MLEMIPGGPGPLGIPVDSAPLGHIFIAHFRKPSIFLDSGKRHTYRGFLAGVHGGTWTRSHFFIPGTAFLRAHGEPLNGPSTH
jgi:hypothetical protein